MTKEEIQKLPNIILVQTLTAYSSRVENCRVNFDIGSGKFYSKIVILLEEELIRRLETTPPEVPYTA